MSASQQQPWLLYSYPWMPFPRRIAGYLAEKRIPASTIAIVHVSDPSQGDCVVASQADRYPSRPQGSLPILAIPPTSESTEWLYIRQSMAIIQYIEEACAPGGQLADVNARQLAQGANALERARQMEILTLAEELLVAWNPVRMFGTGAGTMKYPEGSREMLRWVYRTMAAVEKFLADCNLDYVEDDEKSVFVADIVLFHFLDFVEYCYGVDLTVGTGNEVKDVYGRMVTEDYPNVRQFFNSFKKRISAIRDADLGEIAPKYALNAMQSWHEGVL